MGSNTGPVYWMDIFFSLICCKSCIVCLKRLKINEKEAGVGPFLKNQPITLLDIFHSTAFSKELFRLNLCEKILATSNRPSLLLIEQKNLSPSKNVDN